MERKIGEIFKYGDKTLQVKESASNGCDGCFFYMKCSSITMGLSGECEVDARDDGKDVIFVEVQEQPQLNLCEILKYCLQGETFWSPMLDGVKFSCIDEERQMIIVETIEGHFTWEINADGTISIDEVTSPEVMLFPSRTQRDWTKVKYEPKKERFDPKTLKSFDRVITRNEYDEWTCALFSHIGNKPNTRFIYVTCESVYEYCIPYNDKTKHLVGTKEEAPEYYRYWED